MTEREDEEFLNVEECGEICDQSSLVVRAWIRNRRLPYHRVGRRILIKRSDLLAFIEAGRIPARHEDAAILAEMEAETAAKGEVASAG